MAKKKTKGRKKIEIKKIEKESSLYVTFSKRHRGIFKKASELSTLCGAETAIIAFSPKGKAFSFGDPSLESVISRFQLQNGAIDPQIRYTKVTSEENVQKLNQQLDQVKEQLAKEEERGKMIPEQRFEDYLKSLELHELENLKQKILLLAAHVTKPLNEMVLGSVSNHLQNAHYSTNDENKGGDSPIPHDWLKLGRPSCC